MSHNQASANCTRKQSQMLNFAVVLWIPSFFSHTHLFIDEIVLLSYIDVQLSLRINYVTVFCYPC